MAADSYEKNHPELIRAVDFVLNRATEEELIILRASIEKRSGNVPASIERLDFHTMAKQITEGLDSRYSVSGEQIHFMARRLVAGMIVEQAPEISYDELQLLLDQWLPGYSSRGSAGAAGGSESSLPVDLVMHMIDQFIRYSIGRMPEPELRELQETMGDWTTRYWEIFSVETREMLARLLKGEIDSDQFWGAIESRLS